MNLIPGESILLRSESGALVLTTHRIRYEKKTLGNEHVQSMMLEELSFCEMTRSTAPLFLLFGAIGFAGSLMMGVVASAVTKSVAYSLIGMVVGIISALLCVLLFSLIRDRVLKFSSSGGTIKVDADELKHKTAIEFIEACEAAKNDKYPPRLGPVRVP